MDNTEPLHHVLTHNCVPQQHFPTQSTWDYPQSMSEFPNAVYRLAALHRMAIHAANPTLKATATPLPPLLPHLFPHPNKLAND